MPNYLSLINIFHCLFQIHGKISQIRNEDKIKEIFLNVNKQLSINIYIKHNM